MLPTVRVLFGISVSVEGLRRHIGVVLGVLRWGDYQQSPLLYTWAEARPKESLLAFRKQCDCFELPSLASSSQTARLMVLLSVTPELKTQMSFTNTNSDTDTN